MPEDKSFDQYLEKRAEQLGLPTDPEAYQDGGLAVVTGSSVLSQAETIVALLRASGVPAWVKAPLATLAVAEPLLFSVLVPANSLPEAERLLAEHAPSHTPASEESAEDAEDATEEQAAADELEAEKANNPDEAAAPLCLRGRDVALALLVGLVILVVLFGLLAAGMMVVDQLLRLR
jgi:hypothetical protein